jgi:acid stress-induced BolA-like protein IbaG/YrbA
MKVIITESQIRHVIEQQLTDENVSGNGGHSKVYPVTSSFESGKYEITNTKDIDDAINSMLADIKEFPKNQTFIVTIESSESKVPNSGVGMKPGELSRNRAQSASKYLEGKLPKLTTTKINDKGAQGPEWDPKRGSRDPEYTKYQYVILELQATGNGDPKTITKTYCDEKFSGKGKFGNPENGFISDIQKVDLKDGVGKMTLIYNPVEVPDIFVVEYNGKTRSTGLIGTDNEYYRLMIGTILGNYYKDKEKPWWFKDLIYTQIDPSEAKKILSEYREYYDGNDMKHAFPDVIVETTMFRKYKHIIPYMLNPKQIKGYSGESYATSTWSTTIEKIPQDNFVKVFVVGLIGQTRWSFNFACDNQ